MALTSETGIPNGHWARTANVEWCEAVTHAYAYSPYVAEAFNTLSNVFFFFGATMGVARVRRLRLPIAFLATECVIVITVLGSAVFHATQSYWGEILDELPMSLLGAGYLFCLAGTHDLTSGTKGQVTYLLTAVATTVSWAVYLVLHNYQIFTTIFTLQVVVPALISLMAGCRRHLSPSLWVLFLAAILTGRGAWEAERFLHRSGRCPLALNHPAFWLHPCWHLMAALAHFFWMKYAALISVSDRMVITTSPAEEYLNPTKQHKHHPTTPPPPPPLPFQPILRAEKNSERLIIRSGSSETLTIRSASRSRSSKRQMTNIEIGGEASARPSY